MRDLTRIKRNTSLLPLCSKVSFSILWRLQSNAPNPLPKFQKPSIFWSLQLSTASEQHCEICQLLSALHLPKEHFLTLLYYQLSLLQMCIRDRINPNKLRMNLLNGKCSLGLAYYMVSVLAHPQPHSRDTSQSKPCPTLGAFNPFYGIAQPFLPNYL